MLVERPVDVASFLVDYFRKADGGTLGEPELSLKGPPRQELVAAFGPIVNTLMHSLLAEEPEKPVAFLVVELEKMLKGGDDE